MFLLNDTTQWRRWGSNPRPFGLESSTLPLSHCAPCLHAGVLCCAGNCTHSVCHHQAWVLCHPDQVWHKSALTWLKPLFYCIFPIFCFENCQVCKALPRFSKSCHRGELIFNKEAEGTVFYPVFCTKQTGDTLVNRRCTSSDLGLRCLHMTG